MKSKIEWYREVLELEPYSKVFFPLARLLVDMEKYEEALATLEQGLARHPEYVEAKLLQAEVLQRLGKEQELERLIQGIAEAMAEYPAFWEAWASQLEDDDEGQDPAVAMRFLAAWFAGHKFNWAQIIQTGLATLMRGEQELPPLPGALKQAAAMAAEDRQAEPGFEPEPESARAPHVQTAASESESPKPETSGISPSGLSDFQDLESDAEPQADLEPGQQAWSAHDAEAVDNAAQQEKRPSEPADVRATSESDAESVEFAEETEIMDEGPVAQKSLRSFEQALSETDLESEETEGPAALVEDVAEACEQEEATDEAEEAESGADFSRFKDEDEEEDEGEEETFSLRTRTMADLLAEQGDYEGALDIYRELLAMAPQGAARDELEALVETMRRHAGEKPKGNGGRNRKSGGKGGKNAPTGLKGKTKLINALESLAQRLEAKAAR